MSINMTMQLYFNPRRITNANKCDRHTLQEMGTISKVRGISIIASKMWAVIIQTSIIHQWDNQFFVYIFDKTAQVMILPSRLLSKASFFASSD